MFSEPSLFKTLFHFFQIRYRQFRNPKYVHRSLSDVSAGQVSGYQKYSSLAYRSDLSNKTLVFSLEGALLKSSSFFPYFMLVAFEAGSILRALVLFLLYPFICLVGKETGMKMKVMVCFFGIKKDSFRIGAAVLPKFFLENVGLEAFEVLKRGGRKVAVSEFPQVMIESFLRDYLEIDCVVGRELKMFCGYYTGLMEEKRKDMLVPKEMLGEETMINDEVIGISQFGRSLDHQLFSQCKEIYLVRRADKRSWKHLPSHKYPKPLIFHDGRLALRPTPLATLSLFMWIPFGFVLALVRAVIASTLPYRISIPILGVLGFRVLISKPASSGVPPLSDKVDEPKKGLLYVCNHRTLLDPLYVSFSLKENLTAVTYSLSRVSEILSPIKTVRFTRDRDQDARLMERLLSQGNNLVVCPEGTTCREPYLLRFSPLFAEMSDVILPVALSTHVSMFHGTTAGGLKCLDPFFFLMNPLPSYTIHFLEPVSGLSKCHDSQKTRYDIANSVQSDIGKALGGFQCTKLTRSDKYLILAGNEGIVTTKTSASTKRTTGSRVEKG